MKAAAVAYLLWCLVFFGFAGIHRFYAGRCVSGLVWLFTGGLFLFGQSVVAFRCQGSVKRPARS